MDATKLLDQQHDEVSALFEKIENASGAKKQQLCNDVTDALAAHATIEEKIFYPTVLAKQTDQILHESVEEHLGIKRLIADLISMSPTDENFDAKMTVLKEQVEHHVKEERSESLFPKVRKLFDKEQLEAMGQEMQSLYETLVGHDPRMAVPRETATAAPLR